MTLSTNPSSKPKTAMVLAAGLGKRMRPITSTIPKPLVEIRGKALIDYGLDALARNGVERVVVNVHYMADLMRAHLQQAQGHGDHRLRRAGRVAGFGRRHRQGIAGARRSEPFYVINSDTFWIDGYRDNLDLMAHLWNPARMDMSLLIADMQQATGYEGKGDFVMDVEGRLTRVEERDMSPFIYAGVAIMKPEIFAGMKPVKFSLNRVFDDLIEADRLYGVRLGGLWITVGTPAAIPHAEAAFMASAAA